MRMLGRLGWVVAVAVLLSAALGCAPAWAAWTTYRGDPARSGVDSSSTWSLPFASAWTSVSLGGNVYGEPLVYDGLVVVATEADGVYALNESTGQVVWHASAGTAVPSSQLPCGNIGPTVGITSTPVIDRATGRLFVVADTWDGSHASSIQHQLFGFNLADGSGVSGFPVVVDPPGSIPTDQLQRAALALNGGKVVIGYGGNEGDCGTYNGWLVAVPESGGSVQTFEVEPGAEGGAIWGAGDGPVVDSAGDLWATSGNGFGSSYGYQESVLKLDSNLNLLDHWAPSNWSALDSSDNDLGSSDPLLLPGGLVFQIGKAGVGYLLSASSLGGTGGSPVYQAQVCGQTGDASFGGAVYDAGIIYVACSDGLRALSLNTSTHTFSAQTGWQAPPAAIGPPIVAGGLVWATAWNAATLYGLDPQTGKAVVTQATPTMMHFATPAASDGMLFLATGQTVGAYTLANPTKTTNLLQNSSLESASGSTPSCWLLGGYGTNSYTWTRTTDAHTGSYAENLKVSSWSSGDRKLVSAQDNGTCAPAATSGHTYTVSAWYKVPSGYTAAPRFFAYYRSSSGTWTYWAQSPAYVSSPSWTQASWSTPAVPSGATNLSVGMGLSSTGAVTMDDFSLSDNSAGPDTTAPASTITCNGSPCGVGWYSAPVEVALSASDNVGGSGVASIRYTTDGSTPTLVNGTTYTVAFTVASTATVKYRAYDNAGNAEAVNTQLVQIDSTPPAVSLTAPSAGSVLSGTVSLSASASDTVGVDHVDFLVDGSVVGTVKAAPYTLAWNSQSVPDGSHAITGRAVDLAGNASTSRATVVTITNNINNNNLLQNPSLETTSGSTPTCWLLGGYGTNTFTWTYTSDAHSGSHAENLKINSWTGGDRKLVSAQDAGSCAPAASSGHTYTVSVWYKMPSGATGKPLFFAYYRTSSGTWTYWAQSATFAGNSSWTQASWTTPAVPSGATNLSVGMGLNNTGSVTMDDFGLFMSS